MSNVKKFRIIKFKSKPILSAKSVSKSFGRRVILRKIDIHLNRGEMLGLLGSNGAGKSTFMNIVLGVLKSDFGDVFDINALRVEVSGMLAKTGDPYQFNILDLKRTLALDLGVSGAPEHFLVDKNGTIILHHTGDINERVWRAKFAPKLAELN